MTIIHMEGFDSVDSNTMERLPNWVFGSGLYITTSDRWGTGRALYCSAQVSIPVFTLPIQTRTELWVGAAVFKAEAGGSFANGYPLFDIRDPSNNVNVRVHIDGSDNSIRAYDAAGSLIGQTGPGVVANLAWYYLEVYCKCHNTAGEVIVRLNEQVIISGTSLDTDGGGGVHSKVRLSCVYSNINTYWDDFYIDDAQFQGNVRIRTFMPDSDSGTHSDFDRSGGSNDYECVDEVPPNDNTDYIYSTTKGHQSAFGITTGALNTVKAMKMLHCVTLAAGGGGRRIKPLIRSGGADYYGPRSIPLSGPTFEYRERLFLTDPQDGQPWNQTKLEAAEFGLKILDVSTTTSTTSTTTTV